MPWGAKDAMRHTKKASSGAAQRQWAHVANAVLEGGGSEGSAVRQANGVVAKRSYQEGTDYVPETGPYTLHEGEMVFPQDEARQLRKVLPVISLLTGQPAGNGDGTWDRKNEELARPGSKMPAGTSLVKTNAPGSRAYDLSVSATNAPRIPATRLTPVEAPEIGAPVPGAAPVSGPPGTSLVNRFPKHDSDENPLPLRFLDLKDRGVQNAIAAGEAPPATDAGKAMWAKIPPTSLTGSGNLGTPGVTTQPSETGPNVMRILAAAQRQSATDTTQPRSLEEQYRELAAKEPTREQFPASKLPLWRKALGLAAATVAGPQAAGPLADRILHGGEREAEGKFEQAHGDWENKVSGFLRTAKLREEDLQNRNTQSEIDVRNRPKTERPENLDREAFDYYVSKGMNPAEARQQVLKDAQSAKPDRQIHTSPFEAFAYGDAQEKKAAQDFLDLEHRLGSRYRTPSEFEEKYRLFKEDPDTYRAMFGDKSAEKPDRATATRMLNYFDRRRREIQQDFTLDDNQKQEQLKDVENLEKPFLDAVQPGAAAGGKNDRVEVIHPNGQRGTVPRSQLDKAKKKGYREATQQ